MSGMCSHGRLFRRPLESFTFKAFYTLEIGLTIKPHLLVSAVLSTFLHRQSKNNTVFFVLHDKRIVCACVCVTSLPVFVCVYLCCMSVCLCFWVWCCCGLKAELYIEPSKSSTADPGFLFFNWSPAVRRRCVFMCSSSRVRFLKYFISIYTWVLLTSGENSLHLYFKFLSYCLLFSFFGTLVCVPSLCSFVLLCSCIFYLEKEVFIPFCFPSGSVWCPKPIFLSFLILELSFLFKTSFVW